MCSKHHILVHPFCFVFMCMHLAPAKVRAVPAGQRRRAACTVANTSSASESQHRSEAMEAPRPSETDAVRRCSTCQCVDEIGHRNSFYTSTLLLTSVDHMVSRPSRTSALPALAVDGTCMVALPKAPPRGSSTSTTAHTGTFGAVPCMLCSEPQSTSSCQLAMSGAVAGLGSRRRVHAVCAGGRVVGVKCTRWPV